nr:YdgA family protein [Castellaniella defragrans]
MSHRSLKTAAAVAAALALAYTGASWYAGRLAQERVEAWVEQANQEIAAQWASTDPRPVLTIQAYRRGVFSSDVRYGFQFRDDEGRDQTLGLHDALAHGPWPWAAVRQGEWRPAAALSLIEPLPGGLWQPWFDAQPAGTAPWTLRSRIGFDGRVAAQWRLEPTRLADNRLDFSGGLVRIDYDPGTREAAVSGRIDRLAAVDADSGVRVRFEGLDFDGRTTRSGEADLQSRQHARFGEVHVDVPDAPALAFIGPSLSSDTVRTGGLLDSRLAYDLGQLQLDRRDLGRITLALSAEHLDVAGLQALADALGQLNRREDPDAELLEQDRQRLRALAVPVLAAGPRLTLDALRWETPQGTSELKAQAEFRPAPEDAPAGPGRADRKRHPPALRAPEPVQAHAAAGGAPDAARRGRRHGRGADEHAVRPVRRPAGAPGPGAAPGRRHRGRLPLCRRPGHGQRPRDVAGRVRRAVRRPGGPGPVSPLCCPGRAGTDGAPPGGLRAVRRMADGRGPRGAEDISQNCANRHSGNP